VVEGGGCCLCCILIEPPPKSVDLITMYAFLQFFFYFAKTKNVVEKSFAFAIANKKRSKKMHGPRGSTPQKTKTRKSAKN